MTKGWERFFFILAYLTQGSSYMSPRAYAIMHRMHHAYTDTVKDPHSPSFSKNVFTMMWRSRNFYQDIIKNRMEVEPRFTKNLPEWKSFDRLTTGFGSKLIWISLYTAFFIQFNTSTWQYLLLPVIIIMSAFHGAIVNWCAHKYGYINFKLRNTSMNLLFIDILMLGESYHNNHHKNPSAVNFGRRWHEIDPVYPVIRLLSLLRILKMNKLAIVES